MRIRAFALATFVAATALLAFAGSAGSKDSDVPTRLAVPGELIVGFEPSVSDAQASAAVSSVGAKEKKRFRPIKARLVTVEPGSGGGGEEEARQRPPRCVRRAELRRQGAGASQRPELRAALGPPQHRAGRPGRGRNTRCGHRRRRGVGRHDGLDLDRVAVIDTGVDFGHVDLGNSQTASPLMWINPGENCAGCRTDGVDNDGNGYVDDYRGWDFVNGDNNPFDDNGHGTHVAGTIGALGLERRRRRGVNWQTKVMALKFLDCVRLAARPPMRSSAILYAAAQGRRRPEQLVGRRRLLADSCERNRDRRPGGLALRRGGRQRRHQQRRDALLPGRLREREHRLGGRHELERPARVVLELRPKTVDLGAPGVSVYSTIPATRTTGSTARRWPRRTSPASPLS